MNKKRQKNIFQKIFLKLKTFCYMNTNDIGTNRSIFIVVFIAAFFVLFLGLFSFAQSDVINQSVSDSSIKETTKTENYRESRRIKEIGGEVIIDGSLRVLEGNYVKMADLVEISTPVTPSSNHVRLFAVAVGTYTAIKALFDDGAIRTLTNN